MYAYACAYACAYVVYAYACALCMHVHVWHMPRVQGANDFVIFITAGAGSTASGFAYSAWGWLANPTPTPRPSPTARVAGQLILPPTATPPRTRSLIRALTVTLPLTRTGLVYLVSGVMALLLVLLLAFLLLGSYEY